MRLKLSLAAVLILGVVATAMASAKPCSIRPKKGATKEELASMAKVSKDDAQKAALASLPDPSKATVKESELEVEHGCLLWSFDIEVAGRKGVQEVQVDAGDGKILSSEHESPKKEAAEKAKDKTAPKN